MLPPIIGPENFNMTLEFSLDSLVLNGMAFVALIGYFPLAFAVFAMLPPRKACAIAYAVGYMFLPMGFYELPGPLGEFNKYTVMSLAILLAIMTFDSRRLLRYRPTLSDIPWAILVAIPMASELRNGNSGARALMVTLGMMVTPVLAGRLYFDDAKSSRFLALTLLIGGMIYVPICTLENLFSPFFHSAVYGYIQHNIGQCWRLGGWRPMGFMYHGLMVAMFMWSAAAIAVYLWIRGEVKHFWLMVAVCTLTFTAVGMRSLGAMFNMVGCFAVLVVAHKLRKMILLVLIGLIPVSYLSLRITGVVDGTAAIQTLIEQGGNRRQIDSLSVRFATENMVVRNVYRQPLVGYGLQGGTELEEGSGAETAVDSRWIIVLGRHGFIGFAAWILFWWLPILRLHQRGPPDMWTRPGLAHLPVLGVILVYYQLDNMQNYMYNPLVLMAIGGMSHMQYAQGGGVRAQALEILRAAAPFLRLGEPALAAAARQQWGPEELAQREQLASWVLEGVPEEFREHLGLGIRRLVLSLRHRELNAFLHLPPAARASLAMRASLVQR